MVGRIVRICTVIAVILQVIDLSCCTLRATHNRHAGTGQYLAFVQHTLLVCFEHADFEYALLLQLFLLRAANHKEEQNKYPTVTYNTAQQTAGIPRTYQMPPARTASQLFSQHLPPGPLLKPNVLLHCRLLLLSAVTSIEVRPTAK